MNDSVGIKKRSKVVTCKGIDFRQIHQRVGARGVHLTLYDLEGLTKEQRAYCEAMDINHRGQFRR